jgi:hypothetical protein
MSDVAVGELGFEGLVGERARWLLDGVSQFARTSQLPGDLADQLRSDDPPGFFQWLSSQIHGFELMAVTIDAPTLATVKVCCPNGRSWVLQVRLEEHAPHRIDWVQLDRALLEGMEVRVATEADAAGIRDVCRNAPIVLRDHTVTIDPGPRYFDAIRLMEFGATVLVVTHHDRIVAVHCGTFYPIRYGGQEQLMSQILHSRVLEEYAGLGLWSVMNRRLVNAANDRRREASEAGEVPPNGCAYFAVENDATRRLNGAQATWSFQPYRAVLDARRLAERTDTAALAPLSRQATSADVVRIVELLNATHGHEELFRPFTADSLRARLERAPDLYSWPNLRISERAVLGTWMAGRTHIRLPKDESRASDAPPSVRGLVLDYGFEPGAEEEFAALLRVVAAEAVAAGMTDLSVFTSDASPGSEVLRSLASDLEHYELATPYTSEPEGASTRGLYVDQIYF